MLVLICSRFSTPRTVGETPTAVYASIAFAIIPSSRVTEIAADDSTGFGTKKGTGQANQRALLERLPVALYKVRLWNKRCSKRPQLCRVAVTFRLLRLLVAPTLESRLF